MRNQSLRYGSASNYDYEAHFNLQVFCLNVMQIADKHFCQQMLNQLSCMLCIAYSWYVYYALGMYYQTLEMYSH